MSVPFTGEAGKEAACTYEDYRRLPEGAPYQLIGGESCINKKSWGVGL
ncbi:MAG TPA: hypothetical protein GXX19_05180 [Syntrophomonadaceae bacterium]|nr:hypothetical protein [Syntrophomonadaceae bacterium]